MSETETTVPMDSKALFEAAISDPIPEQETPAQEAQPEPEQKTEQARDEHGRFVAKEEKTKAPVAEAQPEQKPTQVETVPPGRLREESEARRQAEARAYQLESKIHQLSAKLQSLEKPQEPIDPFADPQKFRDEGVRQAIDPITRQMFEMREFFSRKSAIASYGQETVQEAYKWLEQAAQAGDPKAGPLLQRVMQSPDPFEDVVSAYKQERAMKTINGDPEKWFEQELEKRKADPAFVSKHFGQQQQKPSEPQSIVKLPPSLSRTPGASSNDAAGTMDSQSLYEYAIR